MGGNRDDRTAALTKTARALRIYEYEDEDGIVFWSFTKLPMLSVRRLRLTDVRGTHYQRHVSDIHSMAFERDILEEEG